PHRRPGPGSSVKFGYRLATIGFVFVAMFSVLVLRLWFVQVAEGASIAAAAEELAWQSRTFEAPRGDIFDRTGELVVTSRYLLSAEVHRTFVAHADRPALVRRLAAVLGVPAADIDQMYVAAGINGRFTVVSVSVETDFELATRLESYPG